jgi:hypothetical protein
MPHQSNLHSKAENALKVRTKALRVKRTKMRSGVYHSFSDDVRHNSKTLGLIRKILEAIDFCMADFLLF